MKIKSIAPWFGGKRTLAPLIARQLGDHVQYFEPFCGSMAVLFSKAPSANETVNDLHGGLVCLARVLADDLQVGQFYDRLQRTLVCEALLRDAKAYFEEVGNNPPWWLGSVECGDSPSLRRSDANMAEYAYWYFLASWMARNGTAGTARLDYQIAVRWTHGGGSPTTRWKSAVESIPQWHDRLRNVVILCRDAFTFLDKFEDASFTSIYCDPPYHSGSRESGNYLHEFDHGDSLFGDDHVRLRDILAGYRNARVVVSYYDCPRIRELYAGWTFIECYRQKHLHNANGRGGRQKEAPELLICNGPAFPEE